MIVVQSPPTLVVQPSPTLVVLLVLLVAAALVFAVFSLVLAARAWARAPRAAGAMAGLACFFVVVGVSLMPIIGVPGSGAALLLVCFAVLYWWPALTERRAAREQRP